MEMASKTLKRTGAARSEAALQAAKGIPSGPGEESFRSMMVRMRPRSGLWQRE